MRRSASLGFRSRLEFRAHWHMQSVRLPFENELTRQFRAGSSEPVGMRYDSKLCKTLLFMPRDQQNKNHLLGYSMAQVIAAFTCTVRHGVCLREVSLYTGCSGRAAEQPGGSRRLPHLPGAHGGEAAAPPLAPCRTSSSVTLAFKMVMMWDAFDARCEQEE